jgi:hypothetical protein
LLPAKLQLTQEGMTESSLFGRLSFRWDEIQGIEQVTVNGVKAVHIRGYQRSKHLTPGYQCHVEELVAMLRQCLSQARSAA